MCAFATELNTVIDGFMSRRESFTALEVRDEIRILGEPVRYREVLRETLDYIKNNGREHSYVAVPTQVLSDGEEVEVWKFIAYERLSYSLFNDLDSGSVKVKEEEKLDSNDTQELDKSFVLDEDDFKDIVEETKSEVEEAEGLFGRLFSSKEEQDDPLAKESRTIGQRLSQVATPESENQDTENADLQEENSKSEESNGLFQRLLKKLRG